MTISPFDLILLLGALQGFILATLLWVNRKGRQLSNRLLAALISSLALMSFAVGVPVSSRWLSLAIEILPFFLAMPIGPLIYFYTKSVLDPAFRLGKSERRHFYSVILDLGAPLIGWVFIGGLLMGFFPQQEGPTWGYVMDEYNTYVDIPRWISVTAYLFLTKRLLNRQSSPSQDSDAVQQRLRWLRQFINAFLLFQTIWLLFMIPYIVPGWRGPLIDQLGWYPVYIPIAILIYWLGLKGYLNTRSEVTSKSLPKSVSSSDLPGETITQVVGLLSTAMQTERLFLDPELTVEKLGQHTRLHPKIISAVLNQHVGKNFNSFINEHRVNEVKQRLTDPAYEYLTLTGIAFDCGFNSQATFQRTFKQLAGMSPGEYVTQQKKTPLKSGFE
jgi:AraC-like DNA-binding protein